MLAARLDRALDIYQQQASATKIIVSGGQGPDEPIPEALAMQRYLIAHGVDKTDILMESHSINTYTNFYILNKSSTICIMKQLKLFV